MRIYRVFLLFVDLVSIYVYHVHSITLLGRKFHTSLDDIDYVAQNELLKRREYVKLPDEDYSDIRPEHLYQLPDGDYAILTVCIRDEETDFSPLLTWMKENRFTTDFVIAEELGFQLFKYIHQYYCDVRAHLIKDSL